MSLGNGHFKGLCNSFRESFNKEKNISGGLIVVLREKDDADYYYNQYQEEPTQENLDLLVKYRPQDEYDTINKKISLDFIREELKKEFNQV